ncbi:MULTISPECIES: hypothetical protein [Kitasatospora]|uniref:Uncharacterized protein n=1 Tax=Kitasatospora cystarginea TaxID=58350 RepID=A0ABN3EK23_9ACTN
MTSTHQQPPRGLKALIATRNDTTDPMLVHYAGHGLLDEDGMLHLTLPGSDQPNVAYNAVSLEVLHFETAADGRTVGTVQNGRPSASIGAGSG